MQNPVRQIKVNGSIALGLCTVLYVLTNVAYFAASELPLNQNQQFLTRNIDLTNSLTI